MGNRLQTWQLLPELISLIFPLDSIKKIYLGIDMKKRHPALAPVSGVRFPRLKRGSVLLGLPPPKGITYIVAGDTATLNQ